jgi:hypothetical protein
MVSSAALNGHATILKTDCYEGSAKSISGFRENSAMDGSDCKKDAKRNQGENQFPHSTVYRSGGFSLQWKIDDPSDQG